MLTVKVTRDFVRGLVRSIRKGLVGGLGNGGDGEMCVQHAVSRAEGWNRPSDRPTCVDSDLRDVGIMINDAGWSSRGARAKGLQRFAIAELGTRSKGFYFSYLLFQNALQEWGNKRFGARCFGPFYLMEVVATIRIGPERDALLTEFANACADVLEGMKTPGSAYLCMADWSDADLALPLPEGELEGEEA